MAPLARAAPSYEILRKQVSFLQLTAITAEVLHFAVSFHVRVLGLTAGPVWYPIGLRIAAGSAAIRRTCSKIWRGRPAIRSHLAQRKAKNKQ